MCSCKRDYAGLLQRGRGGAVARRWPHEAQSTHTDRLWLCAASLMRLAASIQPVPKTAAKITAPHSGRVNPVVLRRAWTTGTNEIASINRKMTAIRIVVEFNLRPNL